jgi:hypothetical protein
VRTRLSARAIPSSIARDASTALAGLLRAKTTDEAIGDAFFERDWTPLWSALVADGWTKVGDRSASSDGDEALDLLDLTVIAEAWGNHLVPLPLLETIAVRRVAGTHVAPEKTLSYALRSHGSWLVPFGDTSDQVVGVRADTPFGDVGVRDAAVDMFARSLPLTIARGPFDELPLEARREVAIITTAGAVGAAAAALYKSIAYAKVREQFGKPIGSFQAVKHRLADMHARIELARSAVAWACADASSVDRATDAALAHCLRTAEDAIQVHGGIGFTREASLHHHLRHVMVARRIVAAATAR